MYSPFASRRAFTRSLAAVSLVAGAFTFVFVNSSSASTKGGIEVRMLDQCDPATFTAVPPPNGPISCVGDGDVTFAELVATLNPAIGGHEDWKFKPSDAKLKSGSSLHVVNRGGETHTFTEVSAFGLGFVPQLNAALPPTTKPAGDSGPMNFVPAGGMMTLTGLTPGAHMFHCMIHPWMRTTVTVITTS